MASRDFVLEIQTEELPSNPLYGAIEQLSVRVPEVLKDARLEYAEVRVLGGPRRLVVSVTELAEHQEDRTVRAKGPAAKAAFDEAGNPTPAAMGFARGKGVDVADLEVVEDANGAYVWAVIEEKGVSATEVLPALFSRLIEQIEWPKSMRWGSGDARFSRPVRGLLALFGAEVVPVTFGGLVAGRLTEGHRFLARGPQEVPAAQDYPLALERGLVIADQDARARLLREGIEAAAGKAAAERGIAVNAVVPEKTFAEVVNLVEWPTVAVGSFDEEFLAVPREVLENAMESHQRYFPLEDADGESPAALRGRPQRRSGAHRRDRVGSRARHPRAPVRRRILLPRGPKPLARVQGRRAREHRVPRAVGHPEGEVRAHRVACSPPRRDGRRWL